MRDDATSAERVRAFLAAERPRQESFLAELVRAPSDNPPGDAAPHAERAASLLEGLGLVVERYRVPDELVRANGMASAVNLVVRHRFGDRRVRSVTVGCTFTSNASPVRITRSEPCGVWSIAFSPMNCGWPRASRI